MKMVTQHFSVTVRTPFKKSQAVTEAMIKAAIQEGMYSEYRDECEDGTFTFKVGVTKQKGASE